MWYVTKKVPSWASEEYMEGKECVVFIQATTKQNAVKALRKQYANNLLTDEVERLAFPVLVELKTKTVTLYTPKHYIEYFLRKGKLRKTRNYIFYSELNKETAEPIVDYF